MVYVVMDQMVGDRLSPRASCTSSANHRCQARRLVENFLTHLGQCTRWQVVYIQTGSISRVLRRCGVSVASLTLTVAAAAVCFCPADAASFSSSTALRFWCILLPRWSVSQSASTHRFQFPHILTSLGPGLAQFVRQSSAEAIRGSLEALCGTTRLWVLPVFICIVVPSLGMNGCVSAQ